MIKLKIAPKNTIWWTRCKQTGSRVDALFGFVRTWWPKYGVYTYHFHLGRFSVMFFNEDQKKEL